MILNEKLFEYFNPDDEATDMLDLEADKKEVESQEVEASNIYPLIIKGDKVVGVDYRARATTINIPGNITSI